MILSNIMFHYSLFYFYFDKLECNYFLVKPIVSLFCSKNYIKEIMEDIKKINSMINQNNNKYL